MVLGHTLGEIDDHIGVNQAPVLPLSGPLFRNIHHGQIQHFQQTVIDKKDRLRLGYLVQLTVEALNVIGNVNQSPHLLRVLEADAEVGPVSPPSSRP